MKKLAPTTVTNAELLDMDKKNGVIEPGFTADIIATDDDPKEKINTVTNVVFVMKDGVQYK